VTTSDRILDAALDLFDRDGYAAVSMSDVRRAAGVSNGSLYHHFPSKPAIAAALRDRALTGWRTAFAAALDEAADTPAAIRAGVAAHLAWGMSHPALARFMLTAPDEPEAAPPAREQRAFLAQIHRWLDARAADGEIVALPAQLQYAVWLGPAQELLRGWLSGQAKRPPAGAAGTLGDAAWRALSAGGAGASR
jgi:AcrR family transcriptional regulator